MVTIKDIAREAGVNVSTVSRALGGSREVSPATRERIRALASQMRYTPDFSARTLVGKGTKLVGVIAPEIRSNFYVQMIDTLESLLGDRGYSLVINTTDFKPEREEKCLQTLKGRKADAVVIIHALGRYGGDPARARRKDSGPPVVYIDPISNPEQADCIRIDEQAGMDMAICHLQALGHRKLGFVGETISTAYRLPLLIRSLVAAGLPYREEWVFSGDERFERGGYLRMKELLAYPEKARPTAVFTAYDDMALGAMKALKEAGVKVPEHLSLVSHDNIREAEFMPTPLTTIFPPVRETACRCAEILLGRLQSGKEGQGGLGGMNRQDRKNRSDGQSGQNAQNRLSKPGTTGASSAPEDPIPPQEYQNILLKPSLVIRESTGPLPASTAGDGRNGGD